MKKSNSKKLYRFIQERKNKENRASCDSFDALKNIKENSDLVCSSLACPNQNQKPLAFSLAHCRSQTYPHSPLVQQSTDNFSSISKKQGHYSSNSHSSINNDTVIIRQGSEEDESMIDKKGYSKWDTLKKSSLTGCLAKMKINHQMRSYDIQQSMTRVEKERASLLIKEKIIVSLLQEVTQGIANVRFS